MVKKQVLSLLLALMVGMAFSFAGAQPVSAASKLGTVKNIKTETVSETSINVSWSKSKNATGYLLYRNETLVMDGSDTAFTDTGLKAGLAYTYVVQAYRVYKKTQWFNKKTGKWQSKKPKKKWRGGKRSVTAYKYGAFSEMKTARTKASQSPGDDQDEDDQEALRPVLRILLPKTKYKDVDKFVARYNATDNAYTIELIKTSTADGIDPAEYDGLIIPGGKHVHPSFYGAKVKCKKHGFDKKLDRLELALVNDFVTAGKPVLGLCRGCQLINVALGGTLKQNIGMTHYKDKRRPTKTKPDTDMRALFGERVDTIHYHHQAIAKLAEGLTVTMVDAKDGTIEAIEHDSLPVIGFQFHPDRMYVKKDPGIRDTGKKCMDYFFDICYDYFNLNTPKNL